MLELESKIQAWPVSIHRPTHNLTIIIKLDISFNHLRLKDSRGKDMPQIGIKIFGMKELYS